MRRLLQYVQCKQYVPILLCDANAKLGSEVSTSVGSCQAAKQNHAGDALHRVMQAFALFAPSTFSEFVQDADDDQSTWAS
eukprot:11260142-Alexandrium_andersonii.AAC.1